MTDLRDLLIRQPGQAVPIQGAEIGWRYDMGDMEKRRRRLDMALGALLLSP